MRLTSVRDMPTRVEESEFLAYDERDPCYTWCFPLRWGPFDATETWRPTPVPSTSTDLTLYVHIPYCTFICMMCPFTHEPLEKHDLDTYVDALVHEIDLYAAHPRTAEHRVTTLYFGGGTASSLRPHHLRRILGHLRTGFSFAEDAEVTLECHPRTVDRAYLEQAREMGVNRVSFGIQSFNQKNIDSLKLHQKIPQSLEILRTAIDVGFPTVAMDLMYRYADQKPASLRQELQQVFDLGVHGLSVYALDPEVNRLRKTKDRQPGVQIEEEMFYFFHDELLANGWLHLAQPDYAKPGHANHHLRDIWGAPQAANLSFGAGAFSQHWNGTTWCNIADSNTYIEAIQEGRMPILMGQKQTWDDAVARYPALGVRTMRVPLEPFETIFGVPLPRLYEHELDRLIELGWVELDQEALVVTRRGKFFIDNISKTFFNPANRGKGQPWGQAIRKLRPETMTTQDAVLAEAKRWAN